MNKGVLARPIGVSDSDSGPSVRRLQQQTPVQIQLPQLPLGFGGFGLGANPFAGFGQLPQLPALRLGSGSDIAQQLAAGARNIQNAANVLRQVDANVRAACASPFLRSSAVCAQAAQTQQNAAPNPLASILRIAQSSSASGSPTSSVATSISAVNALPAGPTQDELLRRVGESLGQGLGTFIQAVSAEAGSSASGAEAVTRAVQSTTGWSISPKDLCNMLRAFGQQEPHFCQVQPSTTTTGAGRRLLQDLAEPPTEDGALAEPPAAEPPQEQQDEGADRDLDLPSTITGVDYVDSPPPSPLLSYFSSSTIGLLQPNEKDFDEKLGYRLADLFMSLYSLEQRLASLRTAVRSSFLRAIFGPFIQTQNDLVAQIWSEVMARQAALCSDPALRSSVDEYAPFLCSSYDLSSFIAASTLPEMMATEPAARRLVQSPSSSGHPSPLGLLVDMGVLRASLYSHFGIFNSQTPRTLGEVMKALSSRSLSEEQRDSVCSKLQVLDILTSIPTINSVLNCGAESTESK